MTKGRPVSGDRWTNCQKFHCFKQPAGVFWTRQRGGPAIPPFSHGVSTCSQRQVEDVGVWNRWDSLTTNHINCFDYNPLRNSHCWDLFSMSFLSFCLLLFLPSFFSHTLFGFFGSLPYCFLPFFFLLDHSSLWKDFGSITLLFFFPFSSISIPLGFSHTLLDVQDPGESCLEVPSVVNT